MGNATQKHHSYKIENILKKFDFCVYRATVKKVQTLKTYCTMTLFAFFSSYNQFVALNIEIKTPATAVLLLKSSEEDIVVKACNGIRTFAEKGTTCSKKKKKEHAFS